MIPRCFQLLRRGSGAERRVHAAHRQPDRHHHPHGGPHPGAGKEKLASLAAHGATMVIFLSIGLVDKVQQALLAGGAYTPDTPAAVVYKATWPEEKTVRCTVGTLAESVHAAGITKTALIVAGGFLGRNYERSKLYDPAFTTEFRKGTDQ